MGRRLKRSLPSAVEPMKLEKREQQTQQQSLREDCEFVPLPVLRFDGPIQRKQRRAMKAEQTREKWIDKLEKDLFHEYLLFQLYQHVRPYTAPYFGKDFRTAPWVFRGVEKVKNELLSKKQLRGLYKHSDTLNKLIGYNTTSERMLPWSRLVIPRWNAYVQRNFDEYVEEYYYLRLEDPFTFDTVPLRESYKPPRNPQSCYVTVPLRDILRPDLPEGDCALFQLVCFEAAITLTDQVAALAQVLPFAIKYVAERGFRVLDRNEQMNPIKYDKDIRVDLQPEPAQGPRLEEFVKVFRSTSLSPTDEIPVAPLHKFHAGISHCETLFHGPHLFSIHSRYVSPERKRKQGKNPLWGSIPNIPDFQFPPCPPNMTNILRRGINNYHKELSKHWKNLYTKSLDRLLTILLGQRLMKHVEGNWADFVCSREAKPEKPAPELRKHVKEDLIRYKESLAQWAEKDDDEWLKTAETLYNRLFDPEALHQYKIPENEPEKRRRRRRRKKPKRKKIPKPTVKEMEDYGCSLLERFIQIKELCSILLQETYHWEKKPYPNEDFPQESDWRVLDSDVVGYKWKEYFKKRRLHRRERRAVAEVCNLLHPYIAPPTKKACCLNYEITDFLSPPTVGKVIQKVLLRDCVGKYRSCRGKYKMTCPCRGPFSSMSDNCIALQLPIIIITDYVERAAGYKTRELELCPQVSPAVISMLHLDASALYELFGSKNGKYYMRNHYHTQITSSTEARRNKLVTMQNFFATPKIDRICEATGLSFEGVVEILPGALHADIRGKLKERITPAKHRKRKRIAIDPATIN